MTGDTKREKGIQEIPREIHSFTVIASHRLILLELVARSIQIGELRTLSHDAKQSRAIPR